MGNRVGAQGDRASWSDCRSHSGGRLAAGTGEGRGRKKIFRRHPGRGVVRIIWHGMNKPDHPAQDKTLAIIAGFFVGRKRKWGESGERIGR